MFDFITGKKSTKKNKLDVGLQDNNEKQGFLGSLRSKLSKTKQKFSQGLANLLLGKKEIDAKVFSKIEQILLEADLGVETTEYVLNAVTNKISRSQTKDGAAVLAVIKEELITIASKCEKDMDLQDKKPTVIFCVGVNGVGKTTTIAKLAAHFQKNNKKVVLAAGDTFRAAAIEQLCSWGQKLDIPVIKQQAGSDSAAVLFDALQSSQAKQADVLLADTAGRLHTQKNLMAELAKSVRVVKKLDKEAPDEILLILDASIGQNAIKQAESFITEIGVTGLIITKLDGTAKAGVVFSIALKFNLPISYIGIGEQLNDLRPFVAKDFVEALF